MSETPQWLIDNLPEVNARTVISKNQKRILFVLIAILIACIWFNPSLTFLWINCICIVFYMVFAHYKLALQFLSIIPANEPAFDPTDRNERNDWPMYSLLIPMYKEESALKGLCHHLGDMDYPKDKMQVMLLIEEDDDLTRKAAEALNLEAPFEVILIPESFPRTKPKACNVAMPFCRGEFLVIYDAEDRPEKDQLKKAICKFDLVGERVVCLQGRLSFYNREHNIMTRLFTADYACWFDFFLRGLHLLDAPIPLGGTSNHFRFDELERLKAWDPFNVTEDCDLGIRLYIDGKRTEMLDSTTWEEATSRVGPWIRQRSRWIKGYFQTYLVHLRQQGRLLKTMGLGRTMHYHFIFGANLFCLFLNPIYWILTLVWLAGGQEFLSGFYPLWLLICALFSFLAGNFAFLFSSMLACLPGKHFKVIHYCLLIPFYWVIMSIAAYKGAFQLITNPFFWEKTEHDGTEGLEA